MGPRDIVAKALARNLDMIAITDHNSAQNVSSVIDAAKDTALTVIPGMEVHSREEAHLICLFETVEKALNFQDIVYDHLPKEENDPEWFGPQYIVDADENIIGECKKLLAMPTDLHVQELVNFVIDLGGIIYPAHIDRQSNSLLRVLGFIPTNIPFDAVEIAQPYEKAVAQYGFLQNTSYSILRSSDAHMIEHLGEKSTFYYLQAPTFDELRKALNKENGRRTSLAILEESELGS